jgi:hypothetical protein
VVDGERHLRHRVVRNRGELDVAGEQRDCRHEREQDIAHDLEGLLHGVSGSRGFGGF